MSYTYYTQDTIGPKSARNESLPEPFLLHVTNLAGLTVFYRGIGEACWQGINSTKEAGSRKQMWLPCRQQKHGISLMELSRLSCPALVSYLANDLLQTHTVTTRIDKPQSLPLLAL